MKLHNAQDAIKQAIEGGWKELRGEITIQKNGVNGGIYHYDWAWGVTATGLPHGLPLLVIFTDPLFWIALGKVRGWNNKWPNEDSKDNAARWFDTHYHNGDENKFWESLS